MSVRCGQHSALRAQSARHGMLALLCVGLWFSGCSSTPPVVALDPGQRSEGAEPAPVEPEQALVVSFEERFDARIRAQSVQLASMKGVAAAAFDTDAGEVYVLTRERLVRLAERAQLGCIAVDEDASIVVAVLQRSSALPTTSLDVYRLGADGERAEQAWSPQHPALWAEPGARCALLLGQASYGVLLRAREARSESLMELWWTGPTEESRALGMGISVPAVLDAVPSGEQLLLLMSRVQADERGYKVARTSVAQLAAGGELTTLMPSFPEAASVAVASEQRTAAVVWQRKGLGSSAELMEAAQVSLQSVFANHQALGDLSMAQPLRTDVFRYVSQDSPPRPFYSNGRWWAVLAPEPFSLHVNVEAVTYQELLVSLDEGRATPQLLPAELYGLRVVDDAQGGFALALGQPVAELPGFHQGVWTANGGFERLQLETSPRQPPLPQ